MRKCTIYSVGKSESKDGEVVFYSIVRITIGSIDWDSKNNSNNNNLLRFLNTPIFGRRQMNCTFQYTAFDTDQYLSTHASIYSKTHSFHRFKNDFNDYTFIYFESLFFGNY